MIAGSEEFRQTLEGDGIVAHAESALPGISLDIVAAQNDTEQDLPPADYYSHINMTKNPKVIGRVLHYLKGSVPRTVG